MFNGAFSVLLLQLQGVESIRLISVTSHALKKTNAFEATASRIEGLKQWDFQYASIPARWARAELLPLGSQSGSYGSGIQCAQHNVGAGYNAASPFHECHKNPHFRKHNAVCAELATQREDCLFASVFVPEGHALDSSKKLPVLVDIHGGYLMVGTRKSAEQVKWIVGQDNCVVTLNYRLGALGFFSHPEIDEPNLGIDDQRIGLQWVQQNIAMFGCDPTRVTLTGDSGGGASVVAHYTNVVTLRYYYPFQGAWAIGPWFVDMWQDDIQTVYDYYVSQCWLSVTDLIQHLQVKPPGFNYILERLQSSIPIGIKEQFTYMQNYEDVYQLLYMFNMGSRCKSILTPSAATGVSHYAYSPWQRSDGTPGVVPDLKSLCTLKNDLESSWFSLRTFPPLVVTESAFTQAFQKSIFGHDEKEFNFLNAYEPLMTKALAKKGMEVGEDTCVPLKFLETYGECGKVNPPYYKRASRAALAIQDFFNNIWQDLIVLAVNGRKFVDFYVSLDPKVLAGHTFDLSLAWNLTHGAAAEAGYSVLNEGITGSMIPECLKDFGFAQFTGFIKGGSFQVLDDVWDKLTPECKKVIYNTRWVTIKDQKVRETTAADAKRAMIALTCDASPPKRFFTYFEECALQGPTKPKGCLSYEYYYSPVPVD